MKWYSIFVIPRENRDRTTKHGCRPPRGESCRWCLTQHSPGNRIQNTWAERGTRPTAQPPCLYFYCLSPIFQTHKGRCLFCWLLDTQVLNICGKQKRTGRREVGRSIFRGPLPRALHIMLSVTLFTWTYQEKESHRDPDPRQTQHAALVVLKRICHQQSGFCVKRENKHLSSKVAEAQMKV